LANQRFTYIEQQVQKLAAKSAAQFLEHFGVRIHLEPQEVDIFWRKQPQLIVGDKQLIKAEENVSSCSDTYHRCSREAGFAKD
jgi:hypothetical protein